MEDKNTEVIETDTKNLAETTDPLDDIFAAKPLTEKSTEHTQEHKQSLESKEKASSSESEDRKELSSSTKNKEETKEDTADLESLKAELAREKSRALENQKYSRQTAQKLKNTLRLVKEMETSGLLDEEDVQKIAASLSNDGDVDLDPERGSIYTIHPLGEFIKIADAELVNLKKYTDDPLLDDKIFSFNHYIQNTDKETVDELMDTLSDLKDNPVALTKKLLSIGKEHYDNVYKDLKESGGLTGLLSKFKEKEEKLNKQIDRLNKKLSQYEDYNKSSYKIDSVQESGEAEPSGDVLDEVFEERDRRYSRR